MAPEAVRHAVGGGCPSGWGRLLSVTNAIGAGAWRQGDSGWAKAGRPGGGGERGTPPPPLSSASLGEGGSAEDGLRGAPVCAMGMGWLLLFSPVCERVPAQTKPVPIAGLGTADEHLGAGR